MPESIHQFDLDDEIYCDTKNLRLNQTSKRLRRLRAFERVYYKKTWEVKKKGHGLDTEHRLDDGNLRYSPSNLTYSLNKKKRWLLPDIIEQRICEYDPHSQSLNTKKKGDQMSTIDERLKIVMYENVNTRHRSSCIRYANSQIQPHIIHKNGKRFNSDTLTKWMDFNTRDRWSRRRRKIHDDRVNQPNFGIEQRPGFFPSEVTYEFLYPQNRSKRENHSHGRTSLAYVSKLDTYYSEGRHFKDTNRYRRKVRRYECMKYDHDEQEYDFENEEMENNEYIIFSSDFMDENEQWSIVFDNFHEQCTSSINFPLDYFIHSPSSSNYESSLHSNDDLLTKVIDCKANKHFQPLPTKKSDKQSKTCTSTNENLLCSLPCENESNFISSMQQSNKKISQANIIPPMFLQRTTNSSFSVLYTFHRTSSLVKATMKYTNPHPVHISLHQNSINLNELIELISQRLDEDSSKLKNKITQTGRIDVNALRGSLPLPLTISEKMVLVKPNSTDKQKAIENENILDNRPNENEQWFDTTKNQYEIFECAICCEMLTLDNVHQLLPCYHTLCQSCLISYIRTSVASATYSSSSISSITCFQPKCSTELNSALVQAFIPHDIYHSYRQTLDERRLFSSGRYRQCPSRACSNLLIVNDNTKPSLMCSCGQRVCSMCLEEYHFPATCKQYKTYEARLRQSSDHILSSAKVGDNSYCYIAEGKNCPSCGEFVEKNGGCPHMTCKCGNEYCWMCLKRWSTHNYAACSTVPESTYELRSSTRSRFFNKALHHRRQRNQYEFDLLTTRILKSNYDKYYNLLLSTYIDLNTLAEFIYVLMQRRRINGNIRAVLGQTASRLEADAFHIKIRTECGLFKEEYLYQIRSRLERTVSNLLHMKKTKVLL